MKKNQKTTTLSAIIREFQKHKSALISLIILVLFLLVVYTSVFFINEKTAATIDLLALKKPPTLNHLLGTDGSGRDVLAQLILGARNSFSIGVVVTLLSGCIGVTIGAISGYYGGKIDNAIMRLVDFITILPQLMLIIVLVTLVPQYNVFSFILIMSSLTWMAKTRLVRAKSLAEKEQEYILASKILGTPNWKIILFQMLPNITSIIIVNLTITLAGNIGIETGLSYLGFGLPAATPSLGTLVSSAKDPLIMQHAWWIWLPASLLILMLMLCINNIGQTIKRALDAKQRA